MFCKIALQYSNPLEMLDIVVSLHKTCKGRLCEEVLDNLHERRCIVVLFLALHPCKISCIIQFLHNPSFSHQLDDVRAILADLENNHLAESMDSFQLEIAFKFVQDLRLPHFPHLTSLSLTLTNLSCTEIDQHISNSNTVMQFIMSFPTLEHLSINANNILLVKVQNIPSLTRLELFISNEAKLLTTHLWQGEI
jgi:hypothetical protein